MPAAIPPTSPANGYAPMGANIPAPQMPQQGAPAPAPAPVGLPPQMQMQAPQQQPQMMAPQQPIPGRMYGGNIPGYTHGGEHVQGVGTVGDLPYGNDTSTDPSTDPSKAISKDGPGGFYQRNSGQTPEAWNAMNDSERALEVARINKGYFGNVNGPGSTGDSAQGVAYAQLAQKALTDQQSRDDLWSKMTNDNAISQNTAEQNYEDAQAKLNEQNRSDAGTIGNNAFQNMLAAVKMSGGTYNKGTGDWTPSAQYTVNPGAAAGSNIARPVLTRPNIPSLTRPY